MFNDSCLVDKVDVVCLSLQQNDRVGKVFEISEALVPGILVSF